MSLRNSLRSLKVLLQLGGGAAMLVAVSESSLAQVSEVDSYERAVISQSKQNALAFIEEFRSSHLTGDLIESLRPEVAREVCADLPSGVSRARRACEQLRNVPVAKATASSKDVKDVTDGTAQSSAAAAPTQPIETQPTGGIVPAPAPTGTVAVAPQVDAPAVGNQSATGVPPTTAADVGGTTAAATTAAESAPPSSDLPQSAAIGPPTPIKSKPVVYVRSDSGADILAQASDSSAIIGTAASNAPLTVLGRDRNWLQVLVPGMTDRAGWVDTSSLQTEAGGIKVIPARGTTSPPMVSGTNTTAAPAAQVAGNTAPAVAPSATSEATAAAASSPSSFDLPQSAAATPPTPIKSRPVVYVRSDSDADILAQAWDGSAIIGTASSNAPLTVLGRDRNWLKVFVPGMTDRAGWVHTSRLQTDAGGIKVDPTIGTAALPVAPGASTTAAPAMQVESNTAPATAPSATLPSATSAATAALEFAPSSSDLSQPAATTTPAIPIKSKPIVYVRSDSGADILAQAIGGSTIIGTVSSDAPLTVLGRDRNWLKVVVPGMINRTGWVHISRLQTDAGGIKVVPATGPTALP